MDSNPNSTNSAPPEAVSPSDHRPTVSLREAIPLPLTSQGGGFTIKIQNFGQSLALDVRIQDIVRIEALNEVAENPTMDSAPDLAVGTMLPEGEFSTQVGFRTSPQTVAALRDGKARAVNYLLVTYQDQFHRSHITQHCFYWHPGLLAPPSCNSYGRVE
jgi:hypothetical protein